VYLCLGACGNTCLKWEEEILTAHVNVTYRFQNDVSLSKHTSTSKTWNEHLSPTENMLSHCCEATGVVLCRLARSGRESSLSL
jgi:hypothetical protein